ncbi:acetyl-CoA acyltransferase [Fluviicoccus keumensis]|uniref:Acetyl-CoA acyltransferase n=1 Tax=Fluviicoccus keumensis TaxID=1435465 RepID=A0A4Q7YP92_9GAMM|nr:thiolase family protein [Fluviicoccus keumensis]RZU38693.1 acetyl-CoA acyltransferase [Fluviicoccus keumensis]
MKEAVIIDAVRTPIGRGHAEKGSLRGWHPVNLYAHAINALLARTGLAPAKVESLITGCVTARGEQGNNVSRLAGLLSNLPPSTDAFTVVRACGSSQEAVHLAALKVMAGDAEYVIAGGVESMGRVPMFSDIGSPDNVNPDLKLKYEIIHQGESAERLCEIHGLIQDDLDGFAAESHRRAWAAQQAGFFRSQIAPLTGLDAAGQPVTVATDEGIRQSVDAAKMAALPRPFRPGSGLISAGNASQIADGAGVMLVADRMAAERDGFRPRARILARVCAAGDPTLALMEVIPATERAVKKAGLLLADIDLFEINEAFAPVPLIWMKALGIPAEKVNVNGGAIAHGHPLGATGAILMGKLLAEMERRGARYGLQTMCIAQGMATATVIERL